MKFKASYIKIIKILGIASVACFLLFLVYKTGCSILSAARSSIAPRSLVVNFQKIYSPVLRNELERFAHQEFNQSLPKRLRRTSQQLNVAFDPNEFHKNLKRNFKIIRRVVWDIDSSGCAYLTISGVEPAFLINNTLILGDKKRLFPSSFFSDLSTDNLHHISFDSRLISAKLPNDQYRFLQTVSKDILRDYNVLYVSPTHIELRDNSDESSFCIVSDELLSVEKIKKVQMKKNFTYDVRFKNCIYEQRAFMRNEKVKKVGGRG